MSYRIRFTVPDGRTGHWLRDYATREEAQRAIDDRVADTGLAYAVEEANTPEDRIRALEAELAQLRDAYDAAVQDRDMAKRSVKRLESTLDMVQASWAASVASEDAWRARSRQHLMDAASCRVRLERAIELGDAMHRAHHSEEWAAYKESLASLRQCPAKASEAPREGGDSGEGEP